jgi:putative endonuclease
MSEKNWVVYLVRCSDNTLYCGITKDPKSRLAAHNTGKGAKYTRSRRPVELVAFSPQMNKSEALKLEYKIKRLPADKKLSELTGKETQMTLKQDMKAIQKEFKELGKKVEKLTKAVEKAEKTQAKPAKAKTVKKAPAGKRAPSKKTSAAKTKTKRAKKPAAKKRTTKKAK